MHRTFVLATCVWITNITMDHNRSRLMELREQ